VGGSGVTVDEVTHRTKGKGRTFYVDPTTTQLVTTVAWQTPTSAHNVVLIDPAGNVVPGSMRRSRDTNEVWTVPNPKPGTWTVLVEDLQQEFFVTETAQTDVQLRLALGAASSGGVVPITAFFAGPNGGVKADVWATVTDPARRSTYVHLIDDGAHNDGEAGDGVYGGSYRATAAGDAASGGEGERSPAVAGSYSVAAVGIAGRNRREDSGSFAIQAGRDANGDGLPDDWQKLHGDPKSDNDGDGLPALCEYKLGTDPEAADTDGGGETDGSEADASNCLAIIDPTDPADDRISPLGGLGVKAAARQGVPYVELSWPEPQTGTLASVTVQRRAAGGSFTTIASGVTGGSYVDRSVASGTAYVYRVVPTSTGGHTGVAAVSDSVTASSDPYPPYGDVQINAGASSAASLKARLSLIAEDVEGGGDDVTTGRPTTGTPVDQLLVRVSNRADFSGAVWRQFSPTLSWTLAARPGQDATVYVQFRDADGNVSDDMVTDTIRYQP
jgi:hypothetical protein